jgi:hypothetical protein
LKFSPALEQVVMKALSKEPANRYADVMAFTQAFESAVSNPASPSKSEAQQAEETGIFARVRGILKRS